MAYYELAPRPRPGLGYADVVAAILGPLAEGGVAAYGIHQQRKTSKEELKQRQQEAAIQAQLQQQAIASQERQHALAQQAALQRTQVSKAWGAQYAPYLVGGAALLALGVVGVAVLRGGR